MITKRDTVTIIVIFALGAIILAIAFSRGDPSSQDGLGHRVELPAAPEPPRH